MIIDCLVLHNFKRFRKEEIHFKDGITGILGNNGTGKSTIVEAILFALYGVQATGISGDYIVSSFAPPKDGCQVRLDFRIGGDAYSVIRTFKKGKSVQHEAMLHKGPALRATGVSQVDTEVRRVLGMGPVDFRNTVYAAQKDLLTLLDNTPAKRKEWFQKALGIDFLKTESDKILKERADAKDGELKIKEGELKAFSDRQNPDELKNLQDSVTGLRTTIADLELQHRDYTGKKVKAEAEYKQFLDRKTEYTSLTTRMKSLDTDFKGFLLQQESVAGQLSGIASLQQEHKKLEPAVSGLDAKKRNFEELREKKGRHDQFLSSLKFEDQAVTDLKNRVKKTKEKIVILDSEKKRLVSLTLGIRQIFGFGPDVPDSGLEQAITSRESELQHLCGTFFAQLERLATEQKKLLTDRETIRNAGADGTCPLCKQTLGDHYTGIDEEYAARLNEIEVQKERISGEQKRAAAEKTRIANQKPALNEIRSLIERQKTRVDIDKELEGLSLDLKQKETSRDSFMATMKALCFDESVFLMAGKEVQELDKIFARYNELGLKIAHGDALKTQLTGLGEQIAKKQKDLAGLKTQVELAAFDPAAGIVLEEALSTANTAIRTAEAEIARTKERLHHTEEKIGTYQKYEATIASLKKETEALKDEIDLLKLTRTVISDYVIYLMQVVRSRLEGEVSRIISEITGGRYEQVLLDEDFNLLVRDIDNDYAIDRFSGGEQDDIAVALRIALSRYLAELHQVHESTLLIFDEIFGSQDEERRSNLLTALRTQESRFPQIILISHISEMQGEFTNTLMVEMGTDLSSTIRELA
jgi:DNA repair protein SbcC/Rad50